MKTKSRIILTASTALTVWLCYACEQKVETPESRFKDLFSDLSTGVPQYQTLNNFTQPEDAFKGDYSEIDLTQSETQFRDLVSRLGETPKHILSDTNLWITVRSKMDPKYPWHLNVQAHISPSNTNNYEVHIEGRQPYD
jgi:hypothetical protein